MEMYKPQDRYVPPEHIASLARALISLSFEEDARELLFIQETYERTLNYYNFLAMDI